MSLFKYLQQKIKNSKWRHEARKRKESRTKKEVFNAIAEGYFMLARILINGRFDINCKNSYDESLLITLCRTSTNENEEKLCFVRFLLKEGASVLPKDNFGRTALYYAKRNGLQKISQELMCNLYDI
ncbi:Hypothetical predicted protein [Mytilus galloprovincialis]|uniref:Uncharacterized protein n=1 Tax=Mytilus galloprovincialis TaxID=29158 RepID=A0A8B6D3N8_MYTGA|nr:Hypothetical predicted protein [Mytilus galloprovincialis]